MTDIFGFEQGDFTNWNTVGVASIETSAVGSIPTEGQFQALITTGFGSVSDTAIENFLGLDFGAIDGVGNGNAIEGSALQLDTITVQAGDVLSFDFNFLTNEVTPTFFNDFSFVSITSSPVEELADTNSSFVSSLTNFFEETGYTTFLYQFPEAGTYDVGIGVVDLIDSVVSSGLLVDNLRVISGEEVMVGTDGADSLFGDVNDDTIFGQGGNDKIYGSEGVNTLYGGDGDDMIFGGSQADTIYGGKGDDTVFASEGNNIVYGGKGDDTIYTGSGDDYIVGGKGSDTIFLGGGEDTVILERSFGSGVDTINNFQLGQTTFVAGDANDFSIVDGASGAEISLFGNLKAIVSNTQASTLLDNINTVFV